MRRILAAIILAASVAGVVHAAIPPITLSITPTVCLAPCTIRADVKIAMNPDNRYWVIQLDGERFQGSTFQLEGDHAAYTQPPVTFKNLPPGDYEVVAVLYRVHGEQFRSRRTLTVNE